MATSNNVMETCARGASLSINYHNKYKLSHRATIIMPTTKATIIKTTIIKNNNKNNNSLRTSTLHIMASKQKGNGNCCTARQ